MKKTIVSLLVVLAALALAFPGCKGREKAAGGAGGTETIAPAPPQPATANDSDALTQTVDVEAGRSDAEGGGLTYTNPPVDTALNGTPQPTGTGTAPPAAPANTRPASTTTR
ncbi:MAG: hypothetical protein M3Q69_06030 [Acidobacteriota bacterium]|nr:hypothetical protein [Acidobacteriota bacterium]